MHVRACRDNGNTNGRRQSAENVRALPPADTATGDELHRCCSASHAKCQWTQAMPECERRELLEMFVWIQGVLEGIPYFLNW